MKRPHRVRRQIDLNAQKKVSQQEQKHDSPAHIARCRKSKKQGSRAKGVKNVVHIEAISRSLLITDTRQGAIERITEPIDGQPSDDGKEADRVPSCEPIAQPGCEHSDKAQSSQVVRVDGLWNSFGDADQ